MPKTCECVTNTMENRSTDLKNGGYHMKNMKKEEILNATSAMPLNLQFFAEKGEDKDDGTETGEKNKEDDPEDDSEEDQDDDLEDESADDSGNEKKFTQAELNEIVQQRIRRDRRDRRKSSQQKVTKETSKKPEGKDGKDNDDASAERTRAEKAEAKLAFYEQRDTVIEADVDKRYAKFVVSEVRELAQETGDEFEDALEEYLEDNPQYLLKSKKEQDSDEGDEKSPKKRKPKFSDKSKDGSDKDKKSYKPPKII